MAGRAGGCRLMSPSPTVPLSHAGLARRPPAAPSGPRSRPHANRGTSGALVWPRTQESRGPKKGGTSQATQALGDAAWDASRSLGDSHPHLSLGSGWCLVKSPADSVG